MRREKLIFLSLLTVLFLSLCGCDTKIVTSPPEDRNVGESMFVEVEDAALWIIVYHKDTKVMYAVSKLSSGAGHFTVLVNPDGSPMIWEE